MANPCPLGGHRGLRRAALAVGARGNMKHQVTLLMADMRWLLCGWQALRTVAFRQYRIRSQRSEEQIHARLLRGDPRPRRVPWSL